MNKKQQKIIDNFDRKILGEGRSFGLGYSILRKLDDNNYEALMAFTACKDYLNDFMYVEGTSKALGKVYGFEHKYTGVLKDKDHFYLGLKPLHHLGGNVYEKYTDIEKCIKDNHENIIKVLNKIEVLLGNKEFSKFEALIDNTLIIKSPKFWSQFSFMFSMYGLIIRWFLDTNNDQVKLDISKLIQQKKDTLISADAIMVLSMQKFFANIDLKKLLDYKYAEPAQPYTVHNYGINSRLGQILK